MATSAQKLPTHRRAEEYLSWNSVGKLCLDIFGFRFLSPKPPKNKLDFMKGDEHKKTFEWIKVLVIIPAQERAAYN